MEDKIREYFAEHGLEYGQTIVFKGLYKFLFISRTKHFLTRACTTLKEEKSGMEM